MFRRTFLKTLIASAGASLVDSGMMAESSEAIAEPPVHAQPKKVVIGGAGITGLCCGYELMKAGMDVTILEAAGRYSGHVLSSSDGLSDGLYADFGADHLTKPGYERFFKYAEQFNLPVIPYPNAEGSWLPYNDNDLRMIGGKFYTNKMLADPKILQGFGFNSREVQFLSKHPWYEFHGLYLRNYMDKIKDPYKPLGVGLDDLDKIPIADIYKREGASEAAMKHLGGRHTSALYTIWRMAAMKHRGIPPSEGEIFRLKGGNDQLCMVFAKQLGSRVKLAHPVTAVQQSANGVTVSYREYGYDGEKALNADPALAAVDVSTLVENGKVTIVGSVRSTELKQRAERLIRSLKGVSGVDNQLVITQATP